MGLVVHEPHVLAASRLQGHLLHAVPGHHYTCLGVHAASAPVRQLLHRVFARLQVLKDHASLGSSVFHFYALDIPYQRLLAVLRFVQPEVVGSVHLASRGGLPVDLHRLGHRDPAFFRTLFYIVKYCLGGCTALLCICYLCYIITVVIRNSFYIISSTKSTLTVLGLFASNFDFSNILVGIVCIISISFDL